MSITFKPKTSVIRPYRREVIAGVGGAGKSTSMGVVSKRPLVIDFDHRWPSDLVDKSDFPEFTETFTGLKALCNDILAADSLPNDRIIVDTATKVIEVIEQHALETDCKGSKENFNAYSHGQKYVQQYFKEFLDLIDQIQAKHKITVTFICHSKLKDQRNPTGEAYQKNCLDLTDKVSDRLKQWADYIGYIWFEVSVDAKARRAIGENVRFISFNENPAYEAKNSSPFTLPEKIEFDKEGAWAEVLFGSTQPLLKELDELLPKLDEGVRKSITEFIEANSVRSYGYAKLKEFVEIGKTKIKKEGK